MTIMELKQLEYFMVTCEKGSFNKAAECLYTTQPNVSKVISSLEKELVEKYHGVTAEGLVESALDKVRIIEEMGYDNLVISIKSSDVLMCAKAHELIAKQTQLSLIHI